MCTLDQKGDSLRGCRFLSKKPYSLLKKKKKKKTQMQDAHPTSSESVEPSLFMKCDYLRPLQPMVINQVT